jgi:hypothetical protein
MEPSNAEMLPGEIGSAKVRTDKLLLVVVAGSLLSN